MPAHPPTQRRQLLLDSAQQVVADHGIRGLTHRAVDRAAGLPEGSCSAYFRTRRALQSAVAEHLAGQLTTDVAELSVELQQRPGDLQYAAQLTTELFVGWLRELGRFRAVLELTLEATRDPELTRLLAGWQQQLVDVVADVLECGGHRHAQGSAETLVASLFGVLLRALLRDAADRPAYLEQTLGLLLEGLLAVPEETGP